MRVVQKILYSVLLSFFIFGGIVFLAFTGILGSAIFDLPRAASVFVFVAFFLMLFLAIFFCFNLWTYRWSGDSRDEMGVPVETSDFVSCDKESPILDYTPEPLTCKADEFEKLEKIETDKSVCFMEDEVLELEDISNGYDGGFSLFSRLFVLCPDNPEILEGVAHDVRHDVQHEVLFEENGIHYINNSVFDSDSEMENELNNDFVKLVESVVNKI
jgi:hypothetical protein